MRLPRISAPQATLAAIMGVMLVVSSNLNWGKDHWKGILEADAKGYYAYLPAAFIYEDPNFGFFDAIEKEKYYNPNFYYDYRASANGKTISKYYVGTALVQLPFFLVAHGIAHIWDFDLDGYSKPYPILINLASVFYLLLGLVFTNRLLAQFQIQARNRAFVLGALLFGTHLFYYSVVEPGMSHIYSFAFIAMFLCYGQRYFSQQRARDILRLGVLLGIIVLIRPVNALVVLSLPFLAGNWDRFQAGLQGFLHHYRQSLFAALAVASILSTQLVYYKIATGNYFVYAYGEEGFHWLEPNIINILFSYKKGLFLYTPLLFLALFGLVPLYRQNRFRALSWMGFFAVLTYIFSCWWMWYYGGSFSSRVYVEYLPVFAILLALPLQHFQPKPLKRTYIIAIALLVVLCQIQTYQYRYFQIHWSEMTQEKYWEVFLRIDKLVK